jgi:hypothetical protein
MMQQQVYIEPNPAVEGDFASDNPRATVLAGPGGLVSSSITGVIVGRFAWATPGGLVTNAGTGAPTGFVHREQQALITVFLEEASMAVPIGMAITLYNLGDFWAKTGTVATIGQKVFASNMDGSIKTGAAGDTIAGYTETKWFVGSPAAVGELIKITTTA